MTTISKSILFGTSPLDENNHSLKLYVSDDDNIVITDAVFNPNPDHVYISIPNEDWEKLVQFVSDEIKSNNNG